jgi:hypothetical protein
MKQFALTVAALACGWASAPGGLADEHVILRVNCGAQEEYVDGAGNRWVPDRWFAEGARWGAVGGTAVQRRGMTVGGTASPQVYLSERFGMEAYEFVVPDGTYAIRLHFAETWEGVAAEGERVFSVAVDDETVLADFDPFAEAGGLAVPVVRTVGPVRAAGGKLCIGFVPDVQKPEVNGIELVAVGLSAGEAGSLAESLGARPPEEETVIIEGVDHYCVADPLFECVRVVLNYRGEDYSPDYVQGISGAAFRMAGPCPCSPTCSAAMWTPDLARLFGYEAEQVYLGDEAAQVEENLPGLIARIRDEVRGGRPVVVWNAFTTAEWDVVCGFDDSAGTFLGRGSYGHMRGEDYASASQGRMGTCLDTCPALGAIFIGEKVADFGGREAELAALEEAVRHGRSPRDRLLEELGGKAPWEFREGQACIEWCAAHLGAVPSEPPDGYALSVYRSTHGAASGFLRGLLDDYPEAEDPLARAAEGFAAEAEALGAACDLIYADPQETEEPEGERKARGAATLGEAARHYGAAVDALAEVLRAVDPIRVQRAAMPSAVTVGDGSAFVRGAAQVKCATTAGKCSFARALACAATSAGPAYTYRDVMGLTGLAFRARWCNEGTATTWCPSAAIGEMPDEQEAFSRLTGWRLVTDTQFGVKEPDREEIGRKMVASIDAGRPICIYDPGLDMAVAYGYQERGGTLLISRSGRWEDVSPLSLEDVGPMQCYLEEPSAPPAAREALREALVRAAANWRRERHDGGVGGREYWYGDAAYGAWIEDLQAYDRYDAETRRRLRDLDGWVYTCLYDARHNAEAFLRQWGALLDGGAAEALARASALYRQEAELLAEWLPEKRGDDAWSREAVDREVAILSEARETEGRAIGEIEATLRLMADG